MLRTTCRADFHPLQGVPPQPLPSGFSLLFMFLFTLFIAPDFYPFYPPDADRKEEPGISNSAPLCPAHLALGPPVLQGRQGVPSRSVCCQPPLVLLLQNGLGKAQWSKKIL